MINFPRESDPIVARVHHLVLLISMISGANGMFHGTGALELLAVAAASSAPVSPQIKGYRLSVVYMYKYMYTQYVYIYTPSSRLDETHIAQKFTLPLASITITRIARPPTEESLRDLCVHSLSSRLRLPLRPSPLAPAARLRRRPSRSALR